MENKGSKAYLTMEILYWENSLIMYKKGAINKHRDMEERKEDLKDVKRYKRLIKELREDLKSKYVKCNMGKFCNEIAKTMKAKNIQPNEKSIIDFIESEKSLQFLGDLSNTSSGENISFDLTKKTFLDFEFFNNDKIYIEYSIFLNDDRKIIHRIEV